MYRGGEQSISDSSCPLSQPGTQRFCERRAKDVHRAVQCSVTLPHGDLFPTYQDQRHWKPLFPARLKTNGTVLKAGNAKRKHRTISIFTPRGKSIDNFRRLWYSLGTPFRAAMRSDGFWVVRRAATGRPGDQEVASGCGEQSRLCPHHWHRMNPETCSIRSGKEILTGGPAGRCKDIPAGRQPESDQRRYAQLWLQKYTPSSG